MKLDQLKQNFELFDTIESIYTGGKVSINEDCSKIFTTIGENINVLEYTTGKKIGLLKGDSDLITSFEVQPTGKYLVSASRSLLVKIWDIEKLSEVRSFKAHEAPIIVVAFEQTGSLFATGSADGSIKVWDLEGGFCTHNLTGHSGVISALKFFKSSSHKKKGKTGLWIASGANDCSVRIWNLDDSKCVKVLTNHTSVVRSLSFSEDGKYLLSGSRDQIVTLWKVSDFSLVRSIPVYESIESAGFISGSSSFYTGGETGLIKLWDFESGNLLSEQKPLSTKVHSLTEVFYLPTSNTFVGISDDHNIKFFSSAPSMQLIREIVGYTEDILCIRYFGQEQKFLATASNSEQIRLYNLETKDCSVIYGHSDTVLCIDVQPDKELLVSGSKDATARVWRVDETTNPLKVTSVALCAGHLEAVNSVSLSRNLDNGIFLVTSSQDRTVKMWDISQASVEGIVTSSYTIQAHDKDINMVLFSPNDKFFATGSHDKTAKLWDSTNGSLVGTFSGHKRGVWALAFAPIEPLLATASGDKSIKLWNTKDFSCIKSFEGHTNSVLDILFLSMGQQLVSSGADGLVKLWTIKTNQCVESFDNHEDKVWTLAAHKDETVLASGGADATISFWKDITKEEIEKKHAAEEELILKEQEFSNSLKLGDYVRAFQLCLAMNHPSKLLKLLRDVSENRPEGDDSLTGCIDIDQIFASLDLERVHQVLDYVKQWNTNGTTAPYAQSILYLILQHKEASDLSSLTKIKEILTALIPYTQRHYSKIDQLISKSFVIDYTLQAMDQS